MTQQTKAMKGIARIEFGSTHGWFVRGYCNGKTHSKLFSDRKNGGKDEALELAQVHRDQLHAHLEAIPKKARRRLVVSDSRNTAGELGVSRITKNGQNDVEYACDSVSWRPDLGVQKSTSFSVKKYGEEKAFKMAVENRRKMMRETHGADIYQKINAEQRKREST